jgi:NAD(P)-dependent dehydrogenase (short-subunit alcohol dehydrogenase family)
MEHKLDSSAKGMVVVTGAASGLGEACTRALDQAGYRVAAGVRRMEDGERLRQTLSERVMPVLLEVTDPQQIAAAAETVRQAAGSAGLAGLVNNAGIASGGPLEFIPIDEFRRTLEINVLGTVAVTQAFLPLLRQGQGRIILNGSISGLFASPFLSPYAASKFALEGIADALRIELKPWNLPVTIIEAGNLATPIWRRSLQDFDRSSQGYPPEAYELYGHIIQKMQGKYADRPLSGLPPEAFAGLVLHILETPRPKARYLLGKDARSKALMRWLPTRLRDWLVWRKVPKK